MNFISPVSVTILIFLYLILNCVALYKLFFPRYVSLPYKIFWLLVVLIFPFVGALVYLAVEKLYSKKSVTLIH